MNKFILLIALLFASPAFAYDSYDRPNPYQEMIDRRDARDYRKTMEQEARKTNDYLLNQQLQRQHGYGAGGYGGSGSGYNSSPYGSGYSSPYSYEY